MFSLIPAKNTFLLIKRLGVSDGLPPEKRFINCCHFPISFNGLSVSPNCSAKRLTCYINLLLISCHIMIPRFFDTIQSANTNWNSKSK